MMTEGEDLHVVRGRQPGLDRARQGVDLGRRVSGRVGNPGEGEDLQGPGHAEGVGF